MKVLIADDEPDVRLGLKTIIDWKSLGFDICGEAASGDECLEKIRNLRPDLVLLDIRMPKMHGLECAQNARAIGWRGKIIVLSGYSDFQYAQSAIRCGVESYLLKPIDEDELTRTVRRIGEEIRDQHLQSRKIDLCLKKARRAVLFDLLAGKAGRGAAPPVNLKELGLEADHYRVVLAEPATEAARFLRAAKIAEDAEALELQDKTAFLVKGGRAVRRLEAALESRRPDGSGVFLALGKMVSVPWDICASYRDAEIVFNRRFFFGRDTFAACGKDLPEKPVPFTWKDADIRRNADRIFSFLQAGNSNEIGKTLSGMERRLGAVDARPDSVANFLVNILLQVRHRVCESYGSGAAGEKNDADTVTRLCGKRRLYEIMDGLRQELEKMTDAVECVQGEHVVDRMVCFIRKNYGGNLKLETLAQSFGYNSAYLGKIFKEKTGKPFHTFLDLVRIEKAEELLRDRDLKVCEISRRVGYENSDYFYFKFHKYLNKSPLEYRKSVLQKGSNS